MVWLSPHSTARSSLEESKEGEKGKPNAFSLFCFPFRNLSKMWRRNNWVVSFIPRSLSFRLHWKRRINQAQKRGDGKEGGDRNMFFFSYPIFPFSLCFPSTSASLPAPFVKRQEVGFHFPPFRFPLMLLKVVPSWNDTFFRSPLSWLLGRRIIQMKRNFKIFFPVQNLSQS